VILESAAIYFGDRERGHSTENCLNSSSCDVRSAGSSWATVFRIYFYSFSCPYRSCSRRVSLLSVHLFTMEGLFLAPVRWLLG